MGNKIFITLGSQKFQFNRLLKAVDELCEKGTVDAGDVFAQIGYSDYLPKNFSYKKFLDGVIEVPNFKPIEYYPTIGQKYPNSNRPLRFVFLSRIMPEKGCDYILEATRLLNEEGYEKRFTVDFYGKIADGYSCAFNEKINSLKNATYQGFLNLREKEGYDQLSNYDMMLFPTYWRGEGFAGVFIDAFISGVPMIATDWAHNRIILEDGKTALFIPTHNVLALKEKMRQCISGDVDAAFLLYTCINRYLA